MKRYKIEIRVVSEAKPSPMVTVIGTHLELDGNGILILDNEDVVAIAPATCCALRGAEVEADA